VVEMFGFTATKVMPMQPAPPLSGHKSRTGTAVCKGAYMEIVVAFFSLVCCSGGVGYFG
jgi:hypothetical protein